MAVSLTDLTKALEAALDRTLDRSGLLPRFSIPGHIPAELPPQAQDLFAAIGPTGSVSTGSTSIQFGTSQAANYTVVFSGDDRILYRGSYDSVVVELIPTPDSSGNASCDFTLVDSGDRYGPYTGAIDPAGNVLAVTAYKKFLVQTVQPFIKGAIVVRTGTWRVRAIPVPSTGSTSISLPSAVNVTQIGGTNAVTAGVAGLLAVAGNVASGATDLGNPVKVGAVYNAVAPIIANGQRVDLQSDTNGYLKAVLATLLAGEDQTLNRLMITPELNYTNIITAATTTIKTGAGVLDRITINNPGTSFVLTIYDSATGSGTKMGTVAVPASSVGTLSYGVKFAIGLTIVSSGTPGDITVGWL